MEDGIYKGSVQIRMKKDGLISTWCWNFGVAKQ